jgi:hypothetical protein
MTNIRLRRRLAAMQHAVAAAAELRRIRSTGHPMGDTAATDFATAPAFFRLPGGVPVVVRTIRPQDADRPRAYVHGLSREADATAFSGRL